MTLSEFRAWLDGYTARMGDAPTAEEWAAIKAKIDQIGSASPLLDLMGPGVAPAPYRPLGPYQSYPILYEASTCGGTAYADAIITN